MAVFPADSVRTKTWGEELLTSADLHAQYDLLHTYLQAALNSTSGHAHTGAANQGPKLSPANLVIASQAAGDTLYASSATAWARLAKGTARQVLQMKSDATIPEWVSSGTGANELVRLDADSKIPAVDGSLLTSLTGSQITSLFGSWNPYSTGTTPWAKDTSYLAATDGIVTMTSTGTVGGFYGYTSAANPPTTLRVSSFDASGFSSLVGITFPVKKGEYWKITLAAGSSSTTQTIYWIPLGA